MRKNITVVGSKTFDAICYLYSSGRIEIAFPNQALGWLPLGIKDPKVERHIDGFYVVFDPQSDAVSKLHTFGNPNAIAYSLPKVCNSEKELS